MARCAKNRPSDEPAELIAVSHLPFLIIDAGVGVGSRGFWPHNDPDSDAQPRKHVDEGVAAEQVEPATNQVADPRLGDAQGLGRRCLL